MDEEESAEKGELADRDQPMHHVQSTQSILTAQPGQFIQSDQ